MIKSLAGSIYTGTRATGGPWAWQPVTLSRLPVCLLSCAPVPLSFPAAPVPRTGSGGRSWRYRGDPTHTRTTDDTKLKALPITSHFSPPLIGTYPCLPCCSSRDRVTGAGDGGYKPTALAKALVTLPLKRGHLTTQFGTGLPRQLWSSALVALVLVSVIGKETGRPPAPCRVGRSCILFCVVCGLLVWIT